MKVESDTVPGLTLRDAVEEDLDLVQTFIHELAEYERLQSEVIMKREDLRENLFGDNARVKVILAEYRRQPAGFAVFFNNFSTFLGRAGLYLEDLYVRPNFRGKGIGKALLVYLARLAVKEGWGRMEWAVLDWNEPAIRFYESIRAKGMSEWTVYRLTGPALKELASQAY